MQLALTQIPKIDFPFSEDKIIQISESELAESETGKEVLAVNANDFNIIPLKSNPVDAYNIEWRILDPENSFIHFYIFDSSGAMQHFSLQRNSFKGTLENMTGEYYLYFDNRFDVMNFKSIWIKVMPIH